MASSEDDRVLDTWLQDADRDLTRAIAAEVDIEDALGQVKQVSARPREPVEPVPNDDDETLARFATEVTAPSDAGHRTRLGVGQTVLASHTIVYEEAVAGFVRELKVLRKGRGLYVDQVSQRVGPALRKVCGVLDNDDAVEVRRKVRDWLEGLARDLPEDLRVAVLAAFAIGQDARLPFYQDRVRWAAGRIGGDDRTVRRRIDEAIDRVARLATAGAVPDVPSSGSTSLAGWHTDELKISLILDQEVPEAFEFRRIVAERDHVDELDLAMTLTKTREFDQPSDLNDLQVDVLYGGTLVKKTLESNDRFGLVLALPAELNRNGWHDYALRYRAPGKGMLPHFVCVPKHRCDTFELRVRFDLDHPPENVWRMEDLYHRDIDTLDPVGEELRPDSAGEVHLQFHNLTPGRAYGIRWGPESGRETPP